MAAGITAAIVLSLCCAAAGTAQNLGSPDFANPPEIRYREGERRLQGVIRIVSGQFLIPSVGRENLRQFQGWDAAAPPPATSKDVGAGPTLRARLGDRVNIAFLNTTDDRLFSYSFDTASQPGVSSFGCDKAINMPQSGNYPGLDRFPNCFHGSSTANLHFHGTHTSPDGLSDNVLVQVLPQPRQRNWTKTFDKIFDAPTIPERWRDLPKEYQDAQMAMIRTHDKEAAAAARKNKLRPPEALAPKNDRAIKAGQWPQYIMGAYPNSFVIPDGATGQYKAGQAPGTHWYHAHKHGSTALHINNGLAGALVIESNAEGGYDHFIRKFYGWGSAYGAHEKIFVFQTIDVTQNLKRAGGGAGPQGGKGGGLVLVNGKLSPTITMRPGEVQLWRMVNATGGNARSNVYPSVFQTQGFTLRQTAMDGVQLSPGNYEAQPFLNGKVPNAVGGAEGFTVGLALAAGNRADLLVQAPTQTGVATFVSRGPFSQQTLFFVNVTGSAVEHPSGAFPTTWPEMPDFLRDLRAPGPGDVVNPNSPVQFQWEIGRTGFGFSPKNPPNYPPHFMINNKQFEQTGPVIDQCMPLGGLQDWVLENWTTITHPFHIHINPFQVTQIDTPTGPSQWSSYAPKDNFVWQDVIALPPARLDTDQSGRVTQLTPGRIRIRHTFLDFVGTYVLHCHILAHEDRGMMQLVRVVPANLYPSACQGNIPEHH
jgi:FtsP/CotA-like multicopper oxidase with cupredoxin domain